HARVSVERRAHARALPDRVHQMRRHLAVRRVARFSLGVVVIERRRRRVQAAEPQLRRRIVDDVEDPIGAFDVGDGFERRLGGNLDPGADDDERTAPRRAARSAHWAVGHARRARRGYFFAARLREPFFFFFGAGRFFFFMIPLPLPLRLRLAGAWRVMMPVPLSSAAIRARICDASPENTATRSSFERRARVASPLGLVANRSARSGSVERSSRNSVSVSSCAAIGPSWTSLGCYCAIPIAARSFAYRGSLRSGSNCGSIFTPVTSGSEICRARSSHSNA